MGPPICVDTGEGHHGEEHKVPVRRHQSFWKDQEVWKAERVFSECSWNTLKYSSNEHSRLWVLMQNAKWKANSECIIALHHSSSKLTFLLNDCVILQGTEVQIIVKGSLFPTHNKLTIPSPTYLLLCYLAIFSTSAGAGLICPSESRKS